MKRWQDRGEVLDSDDEELSLVAGESQSPERASKKQRLEESNDGSSDQQRAVEGPQTPNGEQAPRQEDEDDEPDPGELLPESAAVYGKKAKIVKPIIPSPRYVPPEESGTKDENTASFQTLEQDAKTNQDRSPIGGLLSSQLDDTETLPDIQDFLGPRTVGQGKGTSQDGSDLSSAPPSPLSELDVSPSPPSFQLPRLLPELGQNPTPGRAQESKRHHLVPEVVIPAISAHGGAGRRSLRTRLEKQLHPYLFDRAQYQKQCRERGMRPIRFSEAERLAAETQEASLSDKEDASSQAFPPLGSSSPVRPSLELGDGSPPDLIRRVSQIEARSDSADSEDELPDCPFVRPVSGAGQGRLKRRKLGHGSHVGKPIRTEKLTTRQAQQQDEFSIPPSPPPTSSESNAHGGSRPGSAGFKFPHGLTPAPLPTPQISSDLREQPKPAANSFDADSPPRRSRPSTVSRPRATIVPIDSSTESSGSEGESNVDERPFLRERRRIKGVLPASWLKIDFRAQQKQASPSMTRRRRQSFASPPRTALQRGVAQRVTSRVSNSPSRANPVTVSDGESDIDQSRSASSPARMRQPRLDFDRDRETTAPTDFVDEDRMEVDFVDAMLAGSSRRPIDRAEPRAKGQRNRHHQPRITAAFGAVESKRVDFSEEQRTFRQAAGLASSQPKSRTKTQSKRAPKNKQVQRLSIVDVPTQAGNERIPQFVRLAMRKARGQANNGRHSPSRKHVRLGTRDDTEDATITLRAWYEGSIAPRQTPTPCPVNDHMDLTTVEAHDEPTEPDLQRRTPLAELQRNQQSRLPAPLRVDDSGNKTNQTTVRTTRHSGMRQTRLEPAVVPDEEPLSQPREPPTRPSASALTVAQRRKPIRARAQTQTVPYRGAQLESLESAYDQNHRTAAFERRMHFLTENLARSQRRRVAGIQLERFLHDPDAIDTPRARDLQVRNPIETDNGRRNPDVCRAELAVIHRPRKRQARRVDAETREYRQPSEPLPEVIDLENEIVPQVDTGGTPLQGLRPFGTRYAIDFDILPITLGTYFHESSFIGSGDFAASLNFAGRDLDTSTGRIRIHVDNRVLEWGTWNEDVAAGLSRILAAVSSAVQTLADDKTDDTANETLSLVPSNVDYLLRSTVRYLTRCLAFTDSVDRRPCVQALQRFVEDLLDVAAGDSQNRKSSQGLFSRCMQYALVLATQSVGLCEHHLVPTDLKRRSRDLMTRAANRLASHTLPACLGWLQVYYDENRRASRREAGIRDSDTAVCSIVILRHSLQDLDRIHASFWDVVHYAFNVDISALSSATALDKVWYDILTLLPALEMHSTGILRPGSRLESTQEDWSLVKGLVDRLLSLYSTASAMRSSSMNDYVRATLTRCHYLMTRWGWWRCESLLGTVFDFFARRGLGQLHLEESRGSPRFLDELNKHPSLEVQPEDRSFHIFLKMLVSAFFGMKTHTVYSDKKIGGIAWRFIPNHGRIYRKDAEVRQEDLDALRNHHDLLCTLYYASPPGNRLRVELIQNLVDHSASHREACRLNVRALANLVSFQLSADESLDRLDAFILWFRDIITTTMNQFRLARSEVEQEIASVRAQGGLGVPADMIERTIASNQRQIAATLVDILVAIKRAMLSAKILDAAVYLLDGTSFWEALGLFDPTARRTYGVVEEGLAVIETALEVHKKFSSDIESQPGSDDSQDYGDATALQELASTQLPSYSFRSIHDVLHDPVAHLVSNVFGADAATDDSLLAKIVDTWSHLAQQMVVAGKRTWSSYMNDYNSDAWNQLRDTQQRRKYSSYFLSRAMDSGNIDLAETGTLTSWLKSLVDREAMLKYQHLLTTALLNKYSDNEPLLNNLPFTRHNSSHFEISLPNLRQRRLALLSSVLSNMRDDFDMVMHEKPYALQELRRTYADMLRQLMQAMKTNYQEVQNSRNGDVADVQAQGAYVEFVQQVVSFLQQYTAEICPVDRFFTDSAAFPLPVTDPTYVVGRLRGYVPKLTEGRKRKELAGFVQTVSERAAVDGQQGYLVDQLVAAMAGVLERGNSRAPSLRHVLCTAIFPAYTENALSSACSWIVVLPILEACARMVDKLLYNVKLDDGDSVQAILSTMQVLLESAAKPVRLALTHPGLIALPHVLATVTAIFDFARQCLTCTRHLEQTTDAAIPLVEVITSFSQSAAAIEASVSGSEDDVAPSPINIDTDIQCLWPDTRDFAQKQVKNFLNAEWYTHDGQYYMKRGNNHAEVVVHLVDEEEQRSRLLAASRGYRESFTTIFDGRGKEQKGLQGSSGFGGMVI